MEEEENINIEQFKSIDELYSFIESNITNDDCIDLWVKYRDKTTIEDEKLKAQWEINCLCFDVTSDNLFPMTYSLDNGTERAKKSSDLNDLQIQIIEYVKERASACKHTLLKAKFNHILWKCPPGVKNNNYGLIAISNYIDSIKLYCELYKTHKDKETPFKILKQYEFLVKLSEEIRSDRTPLMNLTNFLLFQYDEFEFYARHNILNTMIGSKLFKPKDFENTLTFFDEFLLTKKGPSDDFLLTNHYLPTALNIAIRIQADVKKWHNEKGLAYLRLAENEIKEDRYWIKQKFHQNAIDSFSRSGNEELKSKAEQLYADLKPKVKLNKVRVPLSNTDQNYLKEYHDQIRKMTQEILKKQPNEIYNIISSGYFFPKKKDILKTKENKETSFGDFATIISFDKNKNISNNLGEKDDIETYRIFSSYVNISLLPYLHSIIITGIKSGILTLENFLLYITKHSWMGKPYSKYDLGGNEECINWVELIAPSIADFFRQIQNSDNNNYEPNFILCMDSLSLKMEGLFRDFCDRINTPTSVSRPKGMQEAYIHDILEYEILKQYFNEDDLLFFKYLFSNTGGLNLRNNVAHCFYKSKDYDISKMLLLLSVLLRLAKFDYKTEMKK